MAESFDSDKTSRQGVLFCGLLFADNDWAFTEQSVTDFGIDVHAETKVKGRPTGRLVALQVKSGRSWFRETYSDGWVYRPSEEHKIYWLNYSLPVVLILVDYEKQSVYWVEVTSDNVISTGKNYKIHVPNTQQLDTTGFAKLREIATAELPRKQRELSPGFEKEVFETEDFQWLPSYTPDGVRHDLFPKEGSTATPSLEVELTAGQDQNLRNFLEKGIGGEFQAKVRRSNFLPKFLIGDDVVKLIATDRRMEGVFPVLFCWRGADGYSFQQEFALKSKRAGSREMVFESLMGQKDLLRLTIDLKKRQANADYSFQIAGCFAKRALEVLQFTVSSMAGPGTLSVLLRDSGEQLFSTTCELEKDYKMVNSCSIVKKYLRLEEYVGKPLKIPDQWFERSDIWAILEAYDILREGKVHLGNCKLTLPVGYDLSERMKDELDGSGNIALSSDTSRRTIAGYDFDFGPCTTVVNDPMIVQEEMKNHVTNVDGVIAYPYVVNVPVRSRSALSARIA